MLETEINILLNRIKKYLADVDAQEFKEIFIDYVEYMAKNYEQDCQIDKYASMVKNVNEFTIKHSLDISKISSFKKNILYRWIQLNFSDEDILQLIHFDRGDEQLELFVVQIENKYL